MIFITIICIFHEVKAFLIFLSLMFFLCSSKRHRYRHRDEMVNEQYLVEEIFERRLAQPEEHERKERDVLRATDSQERRPLLHSIEDSSYYVSKYLVSPNNFEV